MRSIIFGIFAHPDDEAFGPSASLIKAVDEGSELHLILVTDGQAGANPDNEPDLGTTRLGEWRQAASMMHASSSHALHYQDGKLSHSLYPEIGDRIRTVVLRELEQIKEPAELSFVTFDQNGITGHLDHIAVSYITTHLYCTISDSLPDNITLKELAYYCLSMQKAPNKRWTSYYEPIGRDKDYINRTVDVRAFLPRKYAVMSCHRSQRADAVAQRSLGDDILAHDHFRVLT